MTRRSAAAVAITACLTIGCGSSDYYAWGSYQDSLQRSFLDAGVDPRAEIQLLADELEQAEHAGHRAPPGLCAHLAMLHVEAGNTAAARSLLVREKTLFPESTVFVDGLLARLAAK